MFGYPRRWFERLRRRSDEDDDRLLLRAVDGPGDELCGRLALRAEHSAIAAAALSRCLRQLGREPEAQDAIDRALERFPADRLLRLEADALARQRHAPIARGHALLAAGDLAGARAVFIEAIHQVGQRIPSTALASTLCGYGWVEHAAGLPLAALGAFDRAARSEPASLDAWYGLGHSQRALGHERSARLAFGRAARLGPLAPTPLAMIGWCHYENARFEVARRCFASARDRQPRDLEANWGFAWSSWRLGEPVELAFDPALQVGWHASASDLVDLVLHRPEASSVLEALARRALDHDASLAEKAARAARHRDLDWAGEILVDALCRQGRRDEIAELLGAEARPRLLEIALAAALEADDLDQAATLLERGGEELDPLLRITTLERLDRLEDAHGLARRAAEEGRPGAAERAESLARRAGRRLLAVYDDAESAPDDDSPATAVLVKRDHRRASRRGEAAAVAALERTRPEALGPLLDRSAAGMVAAGERRRLGARLLGLDLAPGRPVDDEREFAVLLGILDRAEGQRRLNRRDRRRFERLRVLMAEDEVAAEAMRRVIRALGPEERPTDA